MSNKGFTLIELLAMLVVLGILMVVSIPNITGILDNQKENAIKEDAIRMTDKVKTLMATSKDMEKPKSDECLLVTLDYLDLSEEMLKGPNDANYDRDDSFVVVTYVKNTGNAYESGYEYKYYVRLVEVDGTNKYGINFSSLEDINNKDIKVVDKINNSMGSGVNRNTLGLQSVCSTITKCINSGSGFVCS